MRLWPSSCMNDDRHMVHGTVKTLIEFLTSALAKNDTTGYDAGRIMMT